VEDAIQGKQNTITDGDLTISKTSGLQAALDNKYDDTGGSITGNVTITGNLVVGTTNIIDEIGTKQNTITDGDLTISKTSGLQAALDNKVDDTGSSITGNVTITGDLLIGTTNIINEIGTKQDEITTSTDLSCNSLNTNQLIVNDDLYFDTIVIRRPTGITYNGTDFLIALTELQCWGYNIMINGDIIRYFAEFTNKDVDVGSLDATRDVTNINNNNIETGEGGVVSPLAFDNENISLICKEIPRTKVQDIQSIVLYNRSHSTLDRAEGLAI